MKGAVESEAKLMRPEANSPYRPFVELAPFVAEPNAQMASFLRSLVLYRSLRAGKLKGGDGNDARQHLLDKPTWLEGRTMRTIPQVQEKAVARLLFLLYHSSCQMCARLCPKSMITLWLPDR